MLIKPYSLALALLGTASPAFSQTAEETVSFILYGMEDGRKIAGGTAVIATVKQTNSAPAKYILSPSGKLEVDEVSVKEIEKCKFEVHTITSSRKERRAVYDFGKVSDVTFTMGYGLLNFAGQCAIHDNDGSCNSTALISSEMGTPPQRVRKALSFLKAQHCAGSAF